MNSFVTSLLNEILKKYSLFLQNFDTNILHKNEI
mgnify:CR=1 FL=1